MKRIIPFGTRVIVKRKSIGKTLGNGIIIATDETADSLTEVAEVVAIPELTLADKALLEASDRIITSLSSKAEEGDSAAVEALLKFKDYLQIKTIKVGDIIMVGRYATIQFTVGETGETLSITDPEGIRGLVVESK